MEDCVYLTVCHEHTVCGNAYAGHDCSPCVKCDAYVSRIKACPHFSECGHASSNVPDCASATYCAYRNLRYGDGVPMPKSIKRVVDRLLGK